MSILDVIMVSVVLPQIATALQVPLGPAEMAHCGRTIIGQDDYFGPTKPSVWHGNRRVAMFWVGSGVPTDGFSSISAGPNGTSTGAPPGQVTW
jgi:hypothetical protein